MHYITAADGSRQPIFLVVLGNLFILNVIFISLRLYCRIRHIGEAGKDDYCILAAFLIAVGMNVQSVVHVTYGTGTHIDTIPRENFVTIHKHWYAYQLIYPLALCLVKQSILILYYRIFIHQNLRTWIKVVACFVLLDTVITEIVNRVPQKIFECSHPSRAWDVDEFPRGCINLKAAYFARSGTAILTDLIIMILPMPVLAKLQIPKRRRAAVIGIFLIGSLSLCASIARLIAIHDWSVSNDPSYTAIWILLWSHIEVQVAICTACAITLRPIFRKVSSLSESTSPTPKTYYYTTSSRSRSKKSSQQPVLTGSRAGGGGGGLLSLATPISSSGSQCRRRSSTTMGAEALNVVAVSEEGGKGTREAQRESVVGLEVRVVDGLGDGGMFE